MKTRDEEEDRFPTRKLKTRKPGNLEDVRTLQDLLRHFRIKNDQWNGVLVTDGSGTTWEHASGWAATLIFNDSFERMVFSGSMSHGTVSTSEIMAVLHPLLWLTANKRGVRTGGFHLHVISDSQYVVNSLKISDPIIVNNTKANRELWVAIEVARRYGIVIHSHFMHRDKVDLNRFAHDLANQCRRSQKEINKNLPRDPYKTNPEE